jgi:hypothetical protein
MMNNNHADYAVRNAKDLMQLLSPEFGDEVGRPSDPEPDRLF